jgi:predicted acyltransferase
VGAVIPYSTKKRLNSGQSWITIHYHIIFRTIMLLILGWVLRGLFRFDWDSMNWTSVLGRIGICYLGASLLALHLSIRNQIIATASLLAGYWIVMSFIPVPEHGMAVFDKVGSVAWYVDELVLPAGEQFRFRDGSLVVLATFPAIATTMAGVLAGHWLSCEQAAGKKIWGLVLAGIASIIIALLWNEIFPINKKLWTSSFVMLTSGMSLTVLAILYWVIDIKGYTKWAYFFVVIGANPLTIYFLRGVVRFRYTAGYFFSGLADLSGEFGPAVMAAGIVLIQWALLQFLYRKRIFIKI